MSRATHEMLLKRDVIHRVPRIFPVEGVAALCGESGPFSVFFYHGGLEECAECHVRFEEGWATSEDPGKGATRKAATPREAMVAFFGEAIMSTMDKKYRLSREMNNRIASDRKVPD